MSVCLSDVYLVGRDKQLAAYRGAAVRIWMADKVGDHRLDLDKSVLLEGSWSRAFVGRYLDSHFPLGLHAYGSMNVHYPRSL